MEELYPLRFQPIYKEKLWGGRKLKSVFSKDIPDGKIGESWEISGVKDNVSIVREGPLAGKSLMELMGVYGPKLVGEKVYGSFGNEFPLLIKFLDASDDLSIQVHPDDRMAKKLENAFGKTEMWYVTQSDEGSALITGFQEGTDKEKYLKKLESETLEDILKYQEVDKGEVYFIPARTVHAIGKGILLAEIQQTSDVTYRIYDYNRTDSEGQKRELHTDKALEIMDFSAVVQRKNYEDENVSKAVSCEFFCTNILSGNNSVGRNYRELNSFVILIAVEGKAEVNSQSGSVNLSAGESVLVPATIKELQIEAIEAFKILETYIP